MGLAYAEFISQQLDETVRETLSNARAPSTRANYSLRWRIFSEWCLGMEVDPVACSVPLVLRFLQSQLDQGKGASTIRVYASAISAWGDRWPAIGSASFSVSVSEGSPSLVSWLYHAGTKLGLASYIEVFH